MRKEPKRRRVGILAKNLGTSLKALRKQKEMTLTEVAEKCGITHSTLSKIERAQSWPSEALIIKLAEVLGTSPESLLVPSNPTGIDAVTTMQQALDIINKAFAEGMPPTMVPPRLKIPK